MGFEPTIYRLEVGRLIHWATRVGRKFYKFVININWDTHIGTDVLVL